MAPAGIEGMSGPLSLITLSLQFVSLKKGLWSAYMTQGAKVEPEAPCKNESQLRKKGVKSERKGNHGGACLVFSIFQRLITGRGYYVYRSPRCL